jgi:penicillin amidase
VNDYIIQAKKKRELPVEFSLLRYEPELWTPTDTLTIAKYMAYDLSGHWRGQVFRYSLIQKVSKEKVIDLLPEYPADAPYIIDEIKSAPRVDIKEAFRSAVIPHEFNGSNNWVVSGEKTLSGKPILANDPHLKLRNPSIWYETHLKSPGFSVSGVIFAGIPGIIIGHNRHCSWGVTNVGPDV